VRTAIAFTLCLATAGPAAAQWRAPDVQNYRFVSDIGTGADLWVNPGAAGFNRMVRLLGNMTFDRPPDGGGWSTAQYSVGLQWTVAGFGYQHDDFQPSEEGYSQGDSYIVAAGLAQGRNGFGVARTWRSVGPTEGSWEVGWVSYASSGVSVGLVWRDIGSPVVRDTTLREHVVGAVSFRPQGSGFSISLQGDYQTDGGDFRAFRIGGTVGLLDSLLALALAEWNGDGDFEGFRLGIALGHKSSVITAGAGLSSGGDARTANLGLSLDGPASQ
jgi:hypothetical protein